MYTMLFAVFQEDISLKKIK